MKPTTHTHWRVKETAVAMAHELYDHLMMSNVFYTAWKIRNPGMDAKQLEEEFVAKNLARLLPQARATLTQMLTTCQDDDLREEIYNALLLDATLVRGRVQ